MSNEKQETVSDIVAEMLEFADTDSQTVGRDILRRRIQYFARRIKQAVTDYNHLCNAAKMRESVEKSDAEISQPHSGARRIAETTEATEPTHGAVRKV